MTKEPYYHVFVRRKEHSPGKPNWKYETNLSKDQIIDQFLLRYLSNNNLICSGYIYQATEITAIKVFETIIVLEFVKKDDYEIDRLVNEKGKNVTRHMLELADSKLSNQKIANPTNESLIWFEKLASKFRTMSLLLERRKKGKPNFMITDEYDFQDLVHCFLTIEYNDVRQEQWTPEYAGGSAKIDFLLPEVSITVETKIVTETHTRNNIGEELIIDIAKYVKHPKCDILVCLIYDPKFLLKNKFGFITDLENNPNLKIRVFVIQ